MVKKAPFIGDDNTFITGSKLSTPTFIDLLTGSIYQLNKNCEDDQNDCLNIGTDYDIKNSTSSLLAIFNEYKLTSVDLKSQKIIWNIVYSELVDISGKDSLVLTSNHLGYDLCLEELTKLKALPQIIGSEGWEFETDAPIVAVYQVIRGTRIARIQLCSKEVLEDKFELHNYNSTIFATEAYKTENYENEEKIIFPIIHDLEILLIQNSTDIPEPIRKKDYTNYIIAAILGVGTIIIVVIATLKPQIKKRDSISEDLSPSSLTRQISTSSIKEAQRIVKKNGDAVVKIGKLFIYTNEILGYGSLGTIVYKGEFENRTVAVKRMLRPFHDVATKEISALILADSHPHVIRYFTKAEDW